MRKELYIGPIVFHWAQKSGPFTPMNSNTTYGYYDRTQEMLRRYGMNMTVLQAVDKISWRERFDRHLDAIVKHGVDDMFVSAQIAKSTFTQFGWQYASDWKNGVYTQHPPMHDPRKMAEHLYLHLVAPIVKRGIQFVRSKNGANVLTLLQNTGDWDEGNPSFWWNVADELFNMTSQEFEFWGSPLLEKHYALDGRCDLFTHKKHSKIKIPSATITPGFLHYRNRDSKYLPRRGGKLFRKALRRTLKNEDVTHIFISTWNEVEEGSIIEEACDNRLFFDRTGIQDTWGGGPRRYLKMIKRAVERHGGLG